MTTSGQPGWYDDPHDPSAQRYWDGQNWTPHSQPKSFPPAAAVAPETYAPPSYPVLPAAPDPYGAWAAPVQPQPVGPRARPSWVLPVILIVSVLGVLTLVGGGMVLFAFARSDKPASDQDKIKALVHDFTDDYNRSDPDAMRSLMCSESKKLKSDALRRVRAESGPLTTSVSDVQVTGDSATAEVETKQKSKTDSDTWHFSKEDGAWKVCPTSRRGH
jgi:Protein of unknown function (DUF2510)